MKNNESLLLPINSTHTNDHFLKHFHTTGRHYVRSTPCYKEQHLIKKFSVKSKVPVIAQESGTIYCEKLLMSYCLPHTTLNQSRHRS